MVRAPAHHAQRLDDLRMRLVVGHTGFMNSNDMSRRSIAESSVEPTYSVVWPSSPLGVQQHRPAPRLPTLDGKRVAFLWDYLFRGDELFPVLADELERRFEGVDIVGYETFGNLHGADEKEKVAALPEELRTRQVDAVVSGMGC
jgi:hypothetical protein